MNIESIYILTAIAIMIAGVYLVSIIYHTIVMMILDSKELVRMIKDDGVRNYIGWCLKSDGLIER